MIIVYDTATLAITLPILGNDSMLGVYLDTCGTGKNAFVLADDVNVATRPSQYIVTMTGPLPTGVRLRGYIEITSTSTSIFPNEQPTITVQLRLSDGSADTTASVIINLSNTLGTLWPAQVTTDAGGTATSTYKPTRLAGGAQISATSTNSEHYLQFPLIITVKQPVTVDQQNWLEGSDIKTDAISASKLDGSVDVNLSANSATAFITDAYFVSFLSPVYKEMSYHVAADGSNYIYISGRDDAGVDHLKKVDKNTGTVSATYTMAAGEEIKTTGCMVCDGKYLYAIYKPSGADFKYIAKFDTATMALVTYWDFTVDDYAFYAIIWTGTQILANVYRLSTTESLIIGIDPTTGVATPITTFTAGSQMVSLQQFAMNQDSVFIVTDEWPAGRIWCYNKSTSAVTYATYVAVTIPFSMATDGTYIYLGNFGNGTAITLKKIALDGTTMASKNANTVGEPWFLSFDGTNLWAATSILGGFSGPANCIRKISPTDLSLTQTFDYSAATVEFANLSMDAGYLYAANRQQVEP